MSTHTKSLPSPPNPLNKKKARFSNENLAFILSWRRLSTQAKLSDNRTVAVDVTVLKVVKE